ncbi:MAG TPA: putative glycolipid-binding domain-containing protein [Croceibacterium sp.]
MDDVIHAFWRRIDRPGHDVARLYRAPFGWVLDGYAVFDENGPTGVRYRVELAADFATIRAFVEGHRSGMVIYHEVERQGLAWTLDGKAARGLDDLVHLDFGFTPATNFQQLRHAALGIGQEAAIDAVWFDIGEASLTRLPQRYRRIAEDRYWYSSPTTGYEAVLETAPNGFVQVYPDIWQMETLRG